MNDGDIIMAFFGEPPGCLSGRIAHRLHPALADRRWPCPKGQRLAAGRRCVSVSICQRLGRLHSFAAPVGAAHLAEVLACV